MFADIGSNNPGFAGTVIDTAIVQDSSISAWGHVGGVAGFIGNLVTAQNVICRQCSFLINGGAGGIASSISLNMPGTRLTNFHCQDNVMDLDHSSSSSYRTSGGMFGSLSAEADDIILNASRVDGCVVTGPTIIGGIAGHIRPRADFQIEDCHVARARIRSMIPGLGGFCGRIMLPFIELPLRRMLLKNCTVQLSDAVEGPQITGGFAGRCSFESDFQQEPYKVVFQGCSSQAGLSCTGAQIGGFIGLVEHCYSQGSVQGGRDTGGIGGLCAESETSIRNNLVLSPSISGSTPDGPKNCGITPVLQETADQSYMIHLNRLLRRGPRQLLPELVSAVKRHQKQHSPSNIW